MNNVGYPFRTARKIVKAGLLPFATWPAHHLLRLVGYYRRPADMPKVERIMAALYGGIGNVILAGPMLKALHERWPGARMHVWAQEKQAVEICRAIPYVHEVLVSGDKNIRSDYDLFVTNCVAPPLRASLFALRCGAQARAGDDQTGSHLGLLFNYCIHSDCSLHEVRRNLDILTAIGPAPADDAPFIRITDEDRLAAAKILDASISPGRRIVGIHPGCRAGQSFKRWSRPRFAELARRLAAEHQAAVVVLGGPDELILARAIARDGGDSCLTVCGLPLLQTAAILERCDVFISNDSGLMHIAAALGTPTVGIFGPTPPRRCSPYGSGHTVVTAGMACQPCHTLEGEIKCRGPVSCMEAVTVDQVLAAAAELLNKQPIQASPLQNVG